MSTSWYEVEVPGRFVGDGVALLDLETRKVPAPEGFRMRNGEVLKRRWSIVMAGVARDGLICVTDGGAEELVNLDSLSDLLYNASEVRYEATREFDEMVAKGRFTNARRAHELRPFYPAVRGAELLNWRNTYPSAAERRNGLRPHSVPRGDEGGYHFGDGARYAAGEAGAFERLAVHNLRDVAELILTVGDPDERAEPWLRRVMVNYEFAADALFGPE